MSQQKSYQITEEVSTVQQNLRAAMYVMGRELRMAGFDPLRTDCAGFENVTSNPQTTLRFSWDVDRDGAITGASEYITYQYDATEHTLERDTGSGAGFEVLAEKISGVSFYFLDQNDIETTTEADIRSVDIILSASYGTHTRQLTSNILCRNMGL